MVRSSPDGKGRNADGAAPEEGGAAIVFWEDIEVGAIYEGGAFAFPAPDIHRFAAEFDPRPTHLDDAAARQTFFKGLSASGAHTFAAWARLYWDITPGWATQAGAELFSMKFLRPIRPDDVLSLRFEVTDKRPYPLKPGFGLIDTEHEVVNQDGKPVLRISCRCMIEQRS